MDRLANVASLPRCLAFDRILAESLSAGTMAPCPTIFYLSIVPGNHHFNFIEIMLLNRFVLTTMNNQCQVTCNLNWACINVA